jgi:hypothetical protein
MSLPWISRGHHAEVIAAKDALIRSLEAQIDTLEKKLEQPVKVTVEMPPDFALLQPAIVRRKRAEASGQAEPSKPAREVDWANVDPSNNYLMAQLAAEEHGRQLGPVELAEWVQRVHRQIAAAKNQQIRTPKIPVVGTLQTGNDAPAHIREMVERAEAV